MGLEFLAFFQFQLLWSSPEKASNKPKHRSMLQTPSQSTSRLIKTWTMKLLETTRAWGDVITIGDLGIPSTENRTIT